MYRRILDSEYVTIAVESVEMWGRGERGVD